MKRYRRLDTTDFFILHEVDENTAYLYPEGGGFIRAIPIDDFNASFVEDESEPEFKRELVSAEWMEACFLAYSNGVRWNGWAVPYFTWEQVDDLAKLMPDAIRCGNGKVEEFDFEEGEWIEVERANLLFDDGPVAVFKLGNGWCWEVVTFPYGNED